MNRYVITRELIKGQEYIISALYDEKGKMIEVIPEPCEDATILGNIYIARVENVVKNLNAAFVKISPDQNCYLPLEDLKHPIFTKKISEKKALVAGDELLVQVCREALKTKEPAVTTNLTFTGKYAVLTTGNRRLSVSSKLSKPQKMHYQELLENYLTSAAPVSLEKDVTATDTVHKTRDYGLIIRTNAAEASDEEVLAEIEALTEQYHSIAKTAEFKTCYSILYQEPASYMKYVNNLRQEELAEIVTDDRGIFEELCRLYHIEQERLMTRGSVSVPVNEITTEQGIRLRFYNDSMITLSALYSVRSNLEEATKERIWLKSGAYLVIQPTEALTVIDVNTGKNVAKKGVQENFLKVNTEAAIEIARQLRLRNISGIVVVDFINLTSKEAEAELLSCFRAALKKDPVPTQIIDITKLGLVEVTRKKVRKSLKEVIG